MEAGIVLEPVVKSASYKARGKTKDTNIPQPVLVAYKFEYDHHFHDFQQ